jgi:hypothetical protein
MRNAHSIYFVKPEEKRPLGKLNCRREDNIKANPKEIGCVSVETESS